MRIRNILIAKMIIYMEFDYVITRDETEKGKGRYYMLAY